MNKSTNLLISNVPADCPEDYVQQWVEARGYRIFKVKLVRDLVSGTSPSFAYVQLMDAAKLDEAARALDERHIGNHALRVKRVTPLPSFVRQGVAMNMPSMAN
jgi:RNA recognition motif. (a.k.a. RRM, RBD, or RNP domain)